MRVKTMFLDVETVSLFSPLLKKIFAASAKCLSDWIINTHKNYPSFFIRSALTIQAEE